MTDDADGFDITVPCWATALTVTQSGEAWIATVTGDAYGTGQPVVTSASGPTPKMAAYAVADKAEGWTTFALAPKDDAP